MNELKKNCRKTLVHDWKNKNLHKKGELSNLSEMERAKFRIKCIRFVIQ